MLYEIMNVWILLFKLIVNQLESYYDANSYSDMKSDAFANDMAWKVNKGDESLFICSLTTSCNKLIWYQVYVICFKYYKISTTVWTEFLQTIE